MDDLKIPNNWTFANVEVAKHFDAHVREQLPWYDLVTFAAVHVARHYVQDGGRIYDIGASTGNIGRALAETIRDRALEYVAIEKAEEMSACFQAPGELLIADARKVEYKTFDVAICFLVLMFLPFGERRDFVLRLLEKCRPGGAVIVVDKLEPCSGFSSTVLSRLAMGAKLLAGISSADILNKELSLSGSQRPLSLTEMPEGAIEFFRFGDFVGFYYERR